MRRLWLIGATVLALAAACTADREEVAEQPAENGGERLLIYAANYPLAYFAERLAGPLAEVRTVVTGDQDPATWRPSLEAVAAIQEADLIVLNGASYESWLESVSLPPSRVVVTTDSLRDRLIPLVGEITHSHGPEGEHEHAGTAFTTWLDPTIAAAQAVAVKDALAARWPERAGQLETRLAALTADLTALDAAAAEAVSGNPAVPVLFSHPVYQYLERRYGLTARSVHWEPDLIPDAAAWAELAAILEDFPASWMIWEATPLPKTRERLESMGVRAVVFDPCATRPAAGDFLSTMQANVESLRRIFADDGA